MKHSLTIAGLLLWSALMAPAADTNSIYHDGWIDLNKNGKKDAYEDPAQPVQKRVADLTQADDAERKNRPALADAHGKGLEPQTGRPPAAR